TVDAHEQLGVLRQAERGSELLDHRLGGVLVRGGVAQGVDAAEDEDAREERTGDSTNDHGAVSLSSWGCVAAPAGRVPVGSVHAYRSSFQPVRTRRPDAYAGAGVWTICGHGRPG